MKVEKDCPWQGGLVLAQSSPHWRSFLLNMGRCKVSCISLLTVQSSTVPHSILTYMRSVWICMILSLQHVPVWFFRDCVFSSAPHSSHLWCCTLWTSCYRGSHTAAQPPFPNYSVAAAPTPDPGTVFTETINHPCSISGPFLAWQSH